MNCVGRTWESNGFRVRILYFTRDYTPHDHRFLSALAESGHDLLFLRLERARRQTEERALPASIQQISWRGGKHPFRWREAPLLAAELRSLVRRYKPDLVHAGPIQSCAFIAALAGCKPLVSMSWGSDLLRDADRSRVYSWITRFALAKSSVLVGDCQAVQSKAEGFGFPTGRTYLFPWGVDLAHFAPSDSAREAGARLRERLGWGGAFVLLSLRSWEPIYGVDLVVRAFAECIREVPQLRLILLGGGSQAPLIQSTLHQNQLHESVYLGGQTHQSDLPGLYCAADLYLSASHSDGSSVSLMEALACARPVLVSNIPGNREWIQPGEQGWLFPDGDAAALADGIRRAASDPAALVRMSHQARGLAEARADWTKNFPVLLKAYQAALEYKNEGV